MEDDLLITNRYNDYINRNNTGDNTDFNKLMDAKKLGQTLYSSSMSDSYGNSIGGNGVGSGYGSGLPEFSKDYKLDRDLGINLPDSSVGLEQFINLGMIDKRKKIKKTVVNIDSKNRKLETTYDKISLLPRKFYEFSLTEPNKPLQFIYNENYAYLLLENTTLNTLEERQIIFKRINDDLTKIGFTSDDFIFDSFNGGPILDIIEYMLDPSIRDNLLTIDGKRLSSTEDEYIPAIFDTKRNLWIFNIIKFKIPTKNNPIALRTASLGGTDTLCDIVSNVQLGYTTTSHYRVNLGKNFSNIYGIRLLSSEIPNASYTFNSNTIVSDFGQYSLKTKINNKLRWIYKNNYIEQPKYSFYAGNMFFKKNYNIQNQKPTIKQQLIDYLNQSLTNITTPPLLNDTTMKSYINNNYRYQSLAKYGYGYDPINLNISDLNIDIRHIGKLTSNGIDISNNLYLPNTYFTYYTYLLPFLNSELGSYQYVLLNSTYVNVEEMDITYNNYYFDINIYAGIDNPLSNIISQYFARYFTIYNLYNSGYSNFNPFIIKLIKLYDGDYDDTDINNVPNDLKTYSFAVFDISGANYDASNTLYYTLRSIPLNYTDASNNLQTLLNIQRQNTTNYAPFAFKYSYVLVIENEIPQQYISDIMKNNNYIYNQLKQYGIKTKSVISPVTITSDIDLSNNTVRIIPDLTISNFTTDNFNFGDPSNLLIQSNNIANIDISGSSFTYVDASSFNYNLTDISGSKIIFNYKTDIIYTYKYLNDASFASYIPGSFTVDLSNNLLKILKENYYSKDYVYNSSTNLFNVFLEEKLQDDLVNNNYIKYGNKYVYYNEFDISYNLITNKYIYNIKIINSNIFNTVLDDQNIFKIELQKINKLNVKNINFVDLSFNDYQNILLNNNCSIIRFYKINNPLIYDEFYLGSNINNNLYEINYKYSNGKSMGEINYFDLSGTRMVMMQELFKTYLRETTDNYMYMNFINLTNSQKIQYNNRMFRLSDTFRPIPNIYEQSRASMINIFNPNINNEYSDLLDIPRYAIIGIYETQLSNGLNITELSQEYVDEVSTDLIIQYPIIDKNSDKLISPFVVSNDPRNGVAYVGDLSVYNRYPLYTSDIDAGKYIETSLQKYFDNRYSSISRKTYDFSKEIFTENDISSRATENNNIYSDGDSKFIIEFDSNIKSLKISNFRKIFQTYTTTSVDNKKNLYVNEGFPYVALHIPDISIPNGGIIRLEGLSSFDNINAKELNKTHYAVIPKNYKITVRQLLPLPSVDYLNNNKNIFTSKGNPLTNDFVKNLYTDYINNSIKSQNTRDLTLDFIVDRLFNTGETGYNNPELFSIKNITGSKQDVKRSSYFINENEFLNGNLNKTFINNKADNIKYNTVSGFNNTNYNDSTRNLTGIEYYGSAYINSARNDRMINELEKQLTTSVDIFVKKGLETSFEENELFVKLGDLYNGLSNNLMGRISGITQYTDENGNFELDYDLFSENGGNFRVGDIIIGLDSNTIGIILPSDYEYNNLPNDEIKVLGLGAYILNNQKELLNNFFAGFYGIDDINNPRYLFAKLFMNRLSSWQITENYTKTRFYVKLQAVPNISRLTGITVNNLTVYVPDFFKFLEGDDTPLNLFGFQDTYYNNKFNYFKDNLQPFETLLINRSYLKRYNNRDIFLLIETKQTGNIQIDDKIFVEEHSIIYNYLESRKNKYFISQLLEPYSSFISKLETLYNTSMLNYNGFNKVVLPKSLLTMMTNVLTSKIYTDRDYLFDYQYTPYNSQFNLDVSYNFRPIIFKNNLISRSFLHDENKYSLKYTLNYRQNYLPNSSLKPYEFKAIYKFNIFNLGITELIVGGTNILTSEFIDDNLQYILRIDGYNFTNIYFKDISSNYNFSLSYTVTNTEPIEFNTYTINIYGFRATYAIKELNTDLSGNIFVSKYDTLGIYQRLMENYIQSFYSMYSFDLNKANQLNSKFNYNIYKNRIIKIKVCGIDECGFSFEPLPSGTVTNNTNYPVRRVNGNSRKLFPFHEQRYYKNWANNKLGDTNLILSSNFISYARPQQQITNNDSDLKQFLPGMGVHIINSEFISNNIVSQARLPASFYEYKTSFIGYVLETSINSVSEYQRNNILNNKSFSRVDVSNSIYSEYYIYLLIDPKITTKDSMINLFHNLNKDYNHIVFDGNSNKDYTNSFLNVDGITISKTKYRYNYDYENNVFSIATNTISDNDGVYTLQENRIGTAIQQVAADKSFILYEDNNYQTTIPIANIDCFSELFAGNIIIKKPKLNDTLPHYDYQFRLACATITERPVFYSSENKDIQLFACGDLDYFYKSYLKDKAVINYKPIIESTDNQYINNQQYIVENPKSANFKQHNFKERDCHSRFIDNNFNNTYEYQNGGIYSKSDGDSINTITPKVIFDSGDDIVLLNTNETLNKYNNSTKEYNLLQKNSNNLIIKDNVKLEKSVIKVLTGGLFPTNYIPHSKLVDNNINDFINNTALLDYKYDESMEKLSKIPLLCKTNGYNLDIIGNNSDLYSYENINNPGTFYNNVSILEYNEFRSHLLNETYTNEVYINGYLDKIVNTNLNNYLETDFNSLRSVKSNIISNQLEFVNNATNASQIPISRLIGCLFLSFSQISFKEYTIPTYNPIQSELAIIQNAQLITTSNGNKVKLTFDNFVKNIHQLSNTNLGNINNHSIPYRVLFTKEIDISTNPTFHPLIAYDTSLNPVNSCIYKWDIDTTGYFISIYDPDKYIGNGDKIIINYSKTEYTTFSYESNTQEPANIYINPINKESLIQNEIMEQNEIINQVGIDPITGASIWKILKPKVGHLAGSSIILLKDPLLGGAIVDPDKSDTNNVERNMLSTQPFTILNKWYTKIFYKGANYMDGDHINSFGYPSKLFNYQDNYTVLGGKEKISKYESKNVFIRGMKGLKLPFIDISNKTKITSVIKDSSSIDIYVFGTNGNSRFDIKPIQPGYYLTKPQSFEDFIPYLNIDSRNLKINGFFDNISNALITPDKIQNILSNEAKWINSDVNYHVSFIDFPYIVVEGLYLGYGGQIQERFDSDITNTMLNNDTGFVINKVKNINNRLLLTVKLPSIYNNFFTSIERNSNLNLKFKNRSDSLPINIESQFNNEFIDLTNDSDDYLSLNIFEPFGKDGRIVKKRINTPYNLNPNNYVFLTIPNLNHILPVQNNMVTDAFAKILLPGESNRVLYNTNVGGGKIYYDNLFNNLNELEIAFLTNDGSLFDFNGSEHSFSLEITEIIDKFEYINPRFGNIEI